MKESKSSGSTLEDRLRSLSVKGKLFESLPEGRVLCYACAHRCTIFPGHKGICKVRYNEGGILYVPGGYVTSLQCDPIEKKPFFHALPGSLALSFGMLGCDYHCSFCQNWVTSQALRDAAAGAPVREITAGELVRIAIESGARSVSSTYNEPIITAEWSVDIFEKAHEAGMYTSYVSNGNATPEVLDYLDPHIDFFKVDLKAFSKKTYRGVGGRLEPVLETIERLVELDKWVEVVTLILPGINDSDGELKEIAAFLAGVSPGIPWRVTAYHPEYKMSEPGPTPVSTLLRAVEIGRKAGLYFIYAGNLPGLVGEEEHTRCPDCGELLIKRYGFRILAYRLDGPRCPACGREIPGRWPEKAIPPEDLF